MTIDLEAIKANQAPVPSQNWSYSDSVGVTVWPGEMCKPCSATWPCDVELLRREVERLTEDNARLQGTIGRQLGECTGCTTEPEETCPIDGRTYADWVRMVSEVIGLLNAEREKVDQLRAIVEAVEKVRDEWAVARLVNGGTRAPITTRAADVIVQQLAAALSSPSGPVVVSGGTE